MRDVPVAQVARALGCKVTEKGSNWRIGPCPACGAKQRGGRRKDKRGAVGSPKRAPAGWRCHACQAEGDTLHWIALSLTSARMGELDDTQRDEVRAWCERFLGLDGQPPIYRPEPQRSPALVYPPADELLQLWDELCGPVTADRELRAWLEQRCIDAELVAELDLARALPPGAAGVSPRWAGFEPPEDKPDQPWRSWAEAGFRLLLPLYDVRGRMRSLIARTARPDAQLKSVSPTGYDRSRLLLADGLGREVLERGRAPEALGEAPRVVIAEGETDLLGWATEPRPLGAIAVLGIVSGSWTAATAKRIPTHSTVVIATDADEAGDAYAETIRASLARRRSIALERWRPSHGEDAGDVKRAGGELCARGEPVGEEPPPEPPAAFRESVGAGEPLRSVERFAPSPVADGVAVPHGYRVTSEGAVWTDPPEGSKSGPRLIASRVPLLRRVLYDPATKEERVEVTFERRGVWRSAIIDRAIISVGGRDTARALGAVGAPIEPRTSRDVAQWVASLEAANERSVPYATVTTRSGWHELESGRRAFVLGGVALDGTGQSDDVVFDDRVDAAGVATHVRAHGDPAEQLALVRHGMRASDALACGVYAALAAPLLERVGAPCFVFHFVGPSSRGKTTALGVAAGLYGSPEVRGGQGWVSSWDTTSVGLEHRAALSSDLPLCLDEAGLVPAEQRERDTYMLVAGQGRTRGAARGGLRHMQAWRTIVLSTGEDALVRERSHAGAQVRALQVRLDGLGTLSGADVADLGAASRQHYGHLGRRFVEQLLGVADAEPLRLRYRAHERRYRKLLGQRSALEQRQAEAFGAMALAEELAADWIGLQAPGAVGRLAESSETRVAVVPEWQRALTAVAEWVASEPGAWPSLDPDTTGTKRIAQPERDGPRLASRFAGFRDRIYVREQPRDVLFIVPEILDERLDARGLATGTVAREWAREGVLVTSTTGSKTRLRQRVRLEGARAWFYCLDVDRMAQLLGPDEPGSPPDPGDPGGDPRGAQRNPAQSRGLAEGGITGSLGSPESRGHARAPARAPAGAHAAARAHAREGDENIVIPVIPPKEDEGSHQLRLGSHPGSPGITRESVIPGAGTPIAPKDEFAAQFEDDWT